VSLLKPQLPKLREDHDLGDFICGATEIDDWLQKRARKAQQAGNANVFVYEHKGAVLGFYALATGGIEHAGSPRFVRENAPDPAPILLLARLGVDEKAMGRGIGWTLLQDALLRSVEISEHVGFRALVIHCRDDSARDFYMHQTPSFVASATDPLHLFISLKSLRAFADSGN
jgi:GNAT superfamily N-acetyltransferase